MRLARCRSGRRYHSAVVRDDRIGLLPPDLHQIADILERGLTPVELEAGVIEWVGSDEVEFLPPIERPDKILCVGLNFPGHAAGAAVPEYPSLFVRFPSSQVGHRALLRPPERSEQFDFEGELAVVIGRPGRDVAESDASRLIGGYACFAENSVRDFQSHSRQVTPGKNFLGSGAFGPWITTPDEIPDILSAELVTSLNGVEMQRARLGEMIFSIPRTLAYISSFTTLLPGDVVAMGTPAGIGALREPPVWMRPGDLLEVSISGVGTLMNRVAPHRSERRQVASEAPKARIEQPAL